MKNILKLSGIIVLVAVIGFSFAACSNGSTDDPPTYTAAIFGVTGSNYTSSFTGESVPSGFGILSGTRDGLIDEVSTAKAKAAVVFTEGTGLSYAEVEAGLQSLVDDEALLTDANKTVLLNELNSKGYVVGVDGLGDGVLVMAAYKE